MPVFGDYETIGGPWFMSGRHGQIRSYWRATSRVREDGRVYFIKSIAVQGAEPPLADPGADFLESVTRLKEAYPSHPELFAPIHGFGRTDSEIWYATDLFPRHSLAEFESSAADIDNRTLEHVVYCLASGCLALQRATGRSHGNLKTSNVLLAGEPGPLRRTPLRLVDPAGSASKKPQGQPASNIRDATELRDLRGIGEIILELVESNPIDGPEDYTLPIEHSVPWRALGKHSQRWLALCNRLLDPGLSMDEISLESLAKDMNPRSTRIPVFFAGLSLTAVLVIASYLFWVQPLKQTTETWAREIKTVPSVPRPAQSVTDSSGRLAEGTRREPPSSRLNTEDTAAPSELDNPRGTDSALDMPSTSQPVASVPAITDAGIDLVDSWTQTPSPGPAEIAPPPATAAASPWTSQAPDSGAPGGTSSGSATSNSDRITSGDTDSGRRDTESTAETATAPPMPPRVHQRRAQVPAQQSGPREAKDERPRFASPAEQPSGSSRSQAEMARTGSGKGRTLARVESSTHSPRTDIANLDEQLRELEAKVAAVVAIRRNSELFARVDTLEAQYAKANQLSRKTKRRFDLLRVNMAKKLPGPPPERPSIESFIPPVVGR